MAIELYKHQRAALDKLRLGSVLCGGVGSGKSRTALAYYYICQGGDVDSENYVRMVNPKPLYIITTARKRDTREWIDEMMPFRMNPMDKSMYHMDIIVDSWNNVAKYKDVYGAFFIFDEQRVVGSGTWVKAFLRIAEHNDWILLTATPGDT